MADTAKLHHTQTRAIGWYAVQRVRIADWFKPLHGKPGKDGSLADQQSQEDSRQSKQDEKIMQRPSANSTDAKKLKAVVRESHTILAKARSVFPFQLFPDSVNIDRHKLTIIRRQFFGIEQKVSVPIENIKKHRS